MPLPLRGPGGGSDLARGAGGAAGLEEVLGAVGALYAEKTAADALCDREGLPRLPLRELLLAHCLRTAPNSGGGGGGCASAARLVAGVLARVRAGGAHPRVALFARFLGLEPAAAGEPIGLDGLGVYLAGLRVLLARPSQTTVSSAACGLSTTSISG